MNKTATFFFALLLLAWGLSGCGSKQDNTGEAKKTEAKLIKVQPVGRHRLVERLQLPATLRAENVANILSTSEGKISQLLVREGDRVEADAVVATISPLVREDIINSARLWVEAKKGTLSNDPHNPVLQREYEQARQDYQFALQQYKEIHITSPIAGVVSRRWVDVGDMVQAKVKLFEIQSSGKLLAEVPVSELDIGKLRLGQTGDIFADACPSKQFTGVVQRIYRQAEAKTRNGIVEMRVIDPCPNLKPGMFVRVTFVTRTLENAVAIPSQAVIERPQKQTCFVVEESKAKEVVLRTGLEVEGWVEVLEGPAPGDMLVVEGQEQLKSGSAVKVQAPLVR
ncbi:MAG: efflux RND transporter periplasmic adaptor subunit [bacterium]|jgi:multidrug efflux pump subunit AcrA (membrane-fusion protein)|nr:efflux RND transporter periplasmic adaptor subunit [candidate division KSB1 bacterium]MDH7560960.1 efflux RND transporter periplasmic adaptor subunit [bacterium]